MAIHSRSHTNVTYLFDTPDLEVYHKTLFSFMDVSMYCHIEVSGWDGEQFLDVMDGACIPQLAAPKGRFCTLYSRWRRNPYFILYV